ncbi:MAG: 5-(carboxyamino)imidazole ribonucleotide synthase [Halioglobus sp.]
MSPNPKLGSLEISGGEHCVQTLGSEGTYKPAPVRRLGIIGGGQLGMLLCRAARDLGITTTVLTPDTSAPAVHETDHILLADYDDPTALNQLILCCDVITFEFEAVPDSTIERLQEAIERREAKVQPEPKTLARLKDKGLQKRWLLDNGLPTLPFKLTDKSTRATDLLSGPLSLPLVQKARTGGYDGKGVQVLTEEADLAALWPIPGLVEPMLDNCTEVAVVVASDGRGALRAYPPVHMAFDPQLNAVRTVTTPATIEPRIQLSCDTIARDAVRRLGSAGVFAVELFVTAKGEVFINELSPRVHNSGHLTLDAFKCDQFEQHLRAIAGLPLGQIVARAPAAAMLNLLYDDSMAPALAPYPYTRRLDAQGHTFLHWYGKRAPKPGRKMGHITALAMSGEAALLQAENGLAKVQAGDLGDEYDEPRAIAS